MAWSTQAYCTLADVHAVLDPNLGTVDDTWLSVLIQQAQADIDREVGYMFQQDGTATTPATRIYDGGLWNGEFFEPQTTLFIDDLVALYGGGGCTPTPCGAVFQIFQTAAMSPGGFWILNPSTQVDITADIILKPANAIANLQPYRRLTRLSDFDFGADDNNIKVLGIFGQPQFPGQIYPGVPNDIMRATSRLAAHYYKMRDTNYADQLHGGGILRETYTKVMPPDVVEVIHRYKRRLFVSRSND